MDPTNNHRSSAGMTTQKLKLPSKTRLRIALAVERFRLFRFHPIEALTLFWRFDEWLRSNELTLGQLQELAATRGTQWAKEAARGIGILIGMVLCFFVLASYWAFTFYTGPATQLDTAPGPVIEAPSGFEKANPLDSYTYLGAEDAATLRLQPDVINIAVLGNGYGARYMRDFGTSLITNPTQWTRVNDRLVVDAFSVDSTLSFVTIQLGTQTYHLNVGQGFIDIKEGRTLFLVDRFGQLWSIPLSKEPLMELAKAKAAIEKHLSPNPDLSFTLKN